MFSMFSSRYLLIFFSFGYACKIKIFSNVDENQSSCKLDNFNKLEKIVESNSEKRDKELKESNALLLKTTGLLNDLIAKIPTGDLNKLEKVIDSKFINTYKVMQDINSVLQNTSGLLIDIMTKKSKEEPLIDVAKGKTAQQSSTHNSLAIYNADKAVDGDKATFSHTEKENGPVWWLDLGQDYLISRIEMFNREDCCGNYFHDVDVTVGPNIKNTKLCASYKGPAKTQEHIVMKCKEPLVGRIVKIAIKNGEKEFLQMAELKVFANKPVL